MRLAFLLFVLSVHPVLAEGDCPALPRRQPMPIEAVPAPIDQPAWRNAVAALDAQLPALQRDSRRLVFIGDSITAAWDPGLFTQFYGLRSPLLLGISGDYTQGLLDRLGREWGPMKPRLAVLLIGTNNTRAGGSKAEDVALGIAEIVRLIHARSPATRILIVGILPIGAGPSEPLRAVNANANAMVARCADGHTVFFEDIGQYFLDGAGQLPAEVSFDSLHLTPVGYAIMAMALEPQIRRIMAE